MCNYKTLYWQYVYNIIGNWTIVEQPVFSGTYLNISTAAILEHLMHTELAVQGGFSTQVIIGMV